MKSQTFLSIATAAMLLLSSCGKEEQKAPEVPLVRLCTVQESLGVRTNSYPGKTEAAQTSVVAFRVSGTLADVPVKVGQHVRQGQMVARMDSRDYEVQLRATQAEYESVKSECERVMALYADNGTSEIANDKARYGLEQITQKLAHAQDQVADCVLRAPFDGYVQQVLHMGHETVSAGMPVVSLFASHGVEVVIYIPAAEYMRSGSFRRYSATFDVKSGKSYDLKLVSIAQKANANQLYEMRLQLKDPEGEITPGMNTTVEIAYAESDNLPVEVPLSAVFADGADDQSCVYVYDKESQTVRKTQVRVNYISKSGKMQVLKGLKPGQKIVEAGVHHLTDGQKVMPAQEPSKTNVGGLL